MAFQYAHHRPMTPITPIHSPHPSAGSSVRARTPGQLSLHEYRKMQVTPSPPAIPGQKTVKKKRGLSSLSRAESFNARPPNDYSYRSFDTLTTPPETPSVAPLMGFSTNVLPIGATTASHVVHAPPESTYPELAHLLGPGSQFENSPPYSPPVPSLSSASRPLHSASPFQPSTPQLFADFESAPPRESGKHPLLGSLVDLGRRPWTQYWEQDRKYAQLHSSITRPRSHQPAGAAAAAAASDRHHLPERPRTTNPSKSSTRGLPLDSENYKLPRTLPLVVSEHPAGNPRVASTPSGDVVGELEHSRHYKDSKQVRQRHFNSIKRLPRPDASTKRRPAPLRLTTSNIDALYHPDNFATSASTFSLSKYAFPKPPQTFAGLEDTKPKSAIVANTSPRDLKSPSVRFSGVSFEIVNPRHSAEDSGVVAASEDGTTDTLSPGRTLQDNRDLRDEEAEKSSEMIDDENRERPPRAQFYTSLQDSFENITRGGLRSVTAPAATTTPPQAEVPPDWRFGGDGSRRSPEGDTITISVRAGPSTSQRDVDRVNSIGRAIEYPESPTNPSVVSPHRHVTETGVSREIYGSGSSFGAGRARGRSIGSGYSFSRPLPDSLRPSATLPDMVQSLRGSGHSGYTNFLRTSIGTSTNTPASARPRDTYRGYSSIFSSPGFGPDRVGNAGDRPSHSSGISSFETNPFHDSRPDSDAFEYDGPAYVRPPRDDSTVGNIIGTYIRHSDAISVYDPPSPVVDPPTNPSRNNISHDSPPVVNTRNSPPRCLGPAAPPGQNPTPHLPPESSPELESSSHAECSTQLGTSTRRPPANQLPPTPAPSATATHIGNGHYVEHGTHLGNGSHAGGGRIELRRRYGLRDIDHLGSVPIDHLETVEDFAEIARDMGQNPVLRSFDEEWDERYLAFMRRAQELYGTQQRREWQRVVSEYHDDPELSDKLEEMAEAATEGIGSPAQTQANVAGGSRPRRPRVITSHDQASLAAGGSSTHRLEPSSSGATVIRHAGAPRIPPLPFRRLSDENHDDDDLLAQHEPEYNSSPLDPSPLPQSTSHQYLTSPGHLTIGNHQESEAAQLHATQEQRYQALVLPEEQMNLEVRHERDARIAYQEAERGHDIGPAPQVPVPNLPYSYNDPSLPFIRPLVPRSTPTNSATEASYGTTGRLLFPHPASPPYQSLHGAAVGQNDGAMSDLRPPHSSRQGGENSIPTLWRNNSSPPGSGNYRGTSRHDPSFDRARDETVDELNDVDEWETEPADSRPTSHAPEFFAFPPSGERRLSGRASYMGGRPVQRSSGGRANTSNLPGFYDPAQLSSEPPDDDHDDATSVPLPARAHIPQAWAQRPDDIELDPMSPRSSNIRAPHTVRPRYRSEDMDRNAFPRTPRARPASVRSSGSRTGRASVRHQTSLQPLRLSQSRASPTQPLLYRTNPDQMTDQQRLVADSVIALCMTVFAPLCLPPFLLGIGVLNQFVGERATKKTKRFALAEAFVFFIIIVITATVGITMSVKEERRANGRDY